MKNLTLAIILVTVFGVAASVALGVSLFMSPPAIQQGPTVPSQPAQPTTPMPATSSSTSQAADCQALTVVEPDVNAVDLSFPLTVKAIVDNRNPKCHWTVFEAQAGGMVMTDASGTVIAQAPLKTDSDWMTDSPVLYQGTLAPTQDYSGPVTIVITDDNPSGRPDPQTVTLHLNVWGFGSDRD